MNRWSKADDNKLLQLLQTNTINSTLTHQAIETVRITHWPDKEYKSFAQLYRKKVRQWSAEQTLQAARRGEYLLLLSCLFFPAACCIHVCCNSSSSSAGVAPPPGPVAPPAAAHPSAAAPPPAAAHPSAAAPPPAAAQAAAQPTRRKVHIDEFLSTPPARDNDEKEKDEADEDDEDEESYSVGADDEDDGENRGVEEEAEEIADSDVDEAAEELEILLLSNSDTDEMQTFLYPWYDESGRQRLTVEFLVIGLAEEDFSAKVSRNGMGLILKYIVPQVFFNPDRLLTASGGSVTETHSKYSAFAKAVHAFKSSIPDGYDKPIERRQQVKLPFKVEQEFAIDDNDDTNLKGFELHAFPHPNKKMRNANQFMFVFAVELVSVIKPQSLKKAKPRKTAFRMVESCESSDSEDDDNNRRNHRQQVPADDAMSYAGVDV
jgi:hypothetical protein